MEHPQIPGFREWRPLSRGGLAVVWEARQLSLDRLVAVKVYQQELDEDGQRRFLRETTAAGKLSDHPGIVTAHDAGILSDGRPYLIMELCSGGSLTQWLRPENRPSEELVRQVGVAIADALVAAHASGLLHRDVKPANILLNRYGNPALADFGLATVADAEPTAAEALCVTPAYAPPEAFQLKRATERGDVFSLAATLYALLAGRPPRDFGSVPIALDQMAHRFAEPVAPLPGVNWHLMEVLMTGLHNDPTARPTAARLRDQLAEVPLAHDRPALAGQVASVQAARWTPRRRTAALVVAAVLATLITPIAWLVGSPSGQSATPTAVSSISSPAAVQSPRSATASPTQQASPTVETRSPALKEDGIRLRQSALVAKPFEAVRLSGTYRGGADTFLRVERREGGRWVAFPVPTKTDRSGKFTAYVELGKPGRYRLRVTHPESGETSAPVVLVVRG